METITEVWTRLTIGKYDQLEGKYWLATSYGDVLLGEYEWIQGRNSDGFNIDGDRIDARHVTHIMQWAKPLHPNHLLIRQP